MLANVPFLEYNPDIERIMELIAPDVRPTHPYTGIYTGSLNFDNSIPYKMKMGHGFADFSGAEYMPHGSDDALRVHWDYWKDKEYRGSYGVCDSIEQMLKLYAPYLNEEGRYYCISFIEMRRDEQYEEGGWRWHKWGEYIGEQNPQHEYLYDEEDIESVFCFHVTELGKKFVENTLYHREYIGLDEPDLPILIPCDEKGIVMPDMCDEWEGKLYQDIVTNGGLKDLTEDRGISKIKVAIAKVLEDGTIETISEGISEFVNSPDFEV